MTPIEAVAIFALTAFAAFTQSLTGFGFGLLIVPPLVLVVGPKEAVVVSNVLATSLGFVMLSRIHAAVDWRTGLTLIAFAALGMPLGFLVLTLLTPTALQVLIAATVILFTQLLMRGLRFHGASFAGDAVAGVLSGILRTATSMSGPPIVLYLQGRQLAPEVFRATITAFFLVSGVMAVAIFTVSGDLNSDTGIEALAGIPALGFGWLVGNALFRRVDETLFRRLVYVVLIVSSLLAIAGAFVG